MKTILIEPVSNGWIVRNHNPEFRHLEGSETIVFTNIEDLIKALPAILEHVQGKKEVDDPWRSGVSQGM